MHSHVAAGHHQRKITDDHVHESQRRCFTQAAEANATDLTKNKPKK
jgi:hypothetical protein